ncbi:MAG: bifunctional oligoribonuclease/PAP phosphatase NrnA [Desulfobacterales bacterium]
MTEQILRSFSESRRVVVTSHENPDGDAVSSLLAVGLALEKQQKNVTFYNASPIPAVYRFLPSVGRITSEFNTADAFDTAVILDCGDLERVGPAAALMRRIPVVVNIDHHITNTGFGTVRLVEPAACATAELVYHLLVRMKTPIDKDLATLIYTGILTDTGSFRFANTNQATFAICLEMAAKGVRPHEVARHVYGTYSLGRIKLLNLALDSIEIAGNGKLSIMTVTREMLRQTGTQPEDADGLIHYARRIEDVRVAALIQELQNGTGATQDRHRYHVSLRSDGSVDVAAVAVSYGGGGHQSAAGFRIEAPLYEVKTQIAHLAKKL